MASIQPIATTRVTTAMTRGRLTAQIQNDQLDLYRLQNQLSTGNRIFLPSDDASAAQRAMVLQRTLERKEQSVTNLQGAKTSLETTYASLDGVNSTLNDLKAQALGVVGTIPGDDERNSVIAAINEALDQLTNIGNSTLASNYLLGGAERSSAAYRAVNGYVEYLGDESSPQTYIDIGQIFDQGVSGDEVFGGLSESIRGVSDLNVQLTPGTRLDRLNGGFGVSAGGSIELRFAPTDLSAPTTSSIIDLSQAKTIDDVARLIEKGAPAGTQLVVAVDNNALRIDATNGGITVNEVGAGRTALELGILHTGVASPSVAGDDLNPTLLTTTRLDDLIGAKAHGRVVSSGTNNDLLISANSNGASFNGVSVVFENTASAGSESATYDAFSNTLTVSIESNKSTAAQVAAAISAEGTFSAQPDYHDQSSVASRGSAVVTASAANLSVGVAGGVDGELDVASGLLVTNGDETYTIDTSNAETIEDLLGKLNDPRYGLLATVNATGDGIDVRTRRSGADFAIGENGGTTATQLGIRTYTESARLADFNRGVGVIITETDDTLEASSTLQLEEQTRIQNKLQITVQDQGITTTYDIDPVGLKTVQDLIDRIAADTGGAVTASLATTGNGLVLTRADAIDAATPATVDIPLAGDTLTFAANTPGPAGNVNFTVNVVDSGSGGLATTLDPDGTTITVDLGGSDADTDAIALSIGGALPGHSVTSAGPVGTIATTDAPVSFGANVTGGFNADEFTVTGNVAERLGFLPADQSSVTSNGASVTSTDRKTLEVDSVFSTLIRMRDALEARDVEGYGREVNRLDDDIDRLTFSKAEVGVRLQNLDSVQQRLADEEVSLRDALSIEIDADLVKVISDFTAKQYALQASLKTAGSILNLSILDFI